MCGARRYSSISIGATVLDVASEWTAAAVSARRNSSSSVEQGEQQHRFIPYRDEEQFGVDFDAIVSHVHYQVKSKHIQQRLQQRVQYSTVYSKVLLI